MSRFTRPVRSSPLLNFKPISTGAVSEAKALTAHLLERTLPEGAVRLGEYYAPTPNVTQALNDGLGSIPIVRPDLSPDVAKALGIKPGEVLGEKELQFLISGRRADGGDIEGHQRKVGKYSGKAAGQKDRFSIAGFDMVFSAPKSVSVAWAFAKTEAEKATILQSHRDARDSALAYIEKEIGHARLGKGGSKGTEPAKFGWVSIDHFTARPTISMRRPDPETGVVGTEIYSLSPNTPGDPHLHTHNIVPNVVVTETGRVVSIHRDLLAHRVHEFGGVYQMHLAENLRKAGIQTDLCDRTLMSAIPSIPEEVCNEFSKRTNDVESLAREAAKRRGLDWDSMNDDAKVRFLKGGAKTSRKAKSDDLANFKDWFNQAADIGWQHETSIGNVTHRSTGIDKLFDAADTARPMLEDLLNKEAVIHGTDICLQAIRALIRHGSNDTDDISKVTRILAEQGVLQEGRKTTLLWSNDMSARVKVTTALHRDQEAELIQLAKQAASDLSMSLPSRELTFSDIASDEQKAAAAAMATCGSLGVFIGTAGAGKTSQIIPPLVKAYQARGYDVWGTAQKWEHADALHEGGIPKANIRSLKSLLMGLRSGLTKVSSNSVIVLDELSRVGTRELLDLLRLRVKIGFKLILTGDPKQCRAIEAGEVIDLLRLALGEDAIPQVLTTNRQRSAREREIANLFREGTKASAARAIDMKLEDQTAEAVVGHYQAVVERIADLVMETGATVSAPTNHDALEIGRAIRRKKQAAGLIGPDAMTVRATDGRGRTYDLTLARGDRVRLYDRTHAIFEGRASLIGNNGSVLAVEDVTAEGLTLRGASGKAGFVKWDALRDGGLVRLGLGECVTIDTSPRLHSRLPYPRNAQRNISGGCPARICWQQSPQPSLMDRYFSFCGSSANSGTTPVRG